MALRHIADHIADRSRVRSLPVHQTLPACPRQYAEQTAQERRLADAISSENGENLTRREREGEIGEQFISAVVGKGDILHRNRDQSPCFSRVRFSRKAKNGAPRSAVRIVTFSGATRMFIER